MAYGDFTLARARRDLKLELGPAADLYREIGEVEVTPLLRETLASYVPLAMALATEKARSEFMIAPILAEVWRRKLPEVSLFSGIQFDVDKDQGLDGFCDFLLARSPIQLFLEAPVLAVVEAKNEDMLAGLGQCAAEMVAARIFNERANQRPATIHGAVTTGNVWKFLRLTGSRIEIDEPEYYIDRLEKVVGILLHCVRDGS